MADRYDEMAYKISGSDGILQRDIAAALRQAVAAERKANCEAIATTKFPANTEVKNRTITYAVGFANAIDAALDTIEARGTDKYRRRLLDGVEHDQIPEVRR